MTGCGPAHQISAVIPQSESGNTFQEGQISTAMIGDSVATSYDLKYLPAFAADQDITIPESLGLKLSTIRKGSQCTIGAKYDNGLLFCHLDPPIINEAAFVKGMPMCLLLDQSGQIRNISWCHTPGDILMPNDYSGMQLKSGKKYTKGSFKSELLYNGKAGNTVKVMYREFIDDIARPSFTQDLLYDISDNKIIGFRNTQIEIIELSNTHIKYRIIKTK